MIQKCDSRLVLYEFYRDPTERRALYDITKLPKLMDKINKYVKKFRVQKHNEYKMYTMVRLGYDSENFLPNVRAQMEDCGHSLWQKALQHEDSTVAGFILGSTQKTNIQVWSQRLERQFKAYDFTNKFKTPIPFALRWKSIYDGMPKDKRPPDWTPTMAIQVEVPRDDLRRGKSYIKAFLLSKHTSKLGNIPYRLLPTVQDSSDEVRAQIPRATQEDG